MSNTDVEDDDGTTSPFLNAGFIASAAVVIGIVIMGFVVVINGNGDGDRSTSGAPTEQTVPTTSAPSAGESTGSAEEEPDFEPSVCGLDDPGADGAETLSSAPEVEWRYVGAFGYPASTDYGPGEDSDGVRTCFQRSPEGAAVAAANMLTVAASGATSNDSFTGAYLADGTYREQIAAELADEEQADADGIRLRFSGVRVLSFDGATAAVDLAVTATQQGETALIAFLYQLEWSEGDWKITSASRNPFDSAVIADLTGYLGWTEGS